MDCILLTMTTAPNRNCDLKEEEELSTAGVVRTLGQRTFLSLSLAPFLSLFLSDCLEGRILREFWFGRTAVFKYRKKKKNWKKEKGAGRGD